MNDITRDLLLAGLYNGPRVAEELALAARYTPVLRFDANEPFLPVAAGYTFFAADGPSPSMKRTIQLHPPGKAPAAVAIEYAIWWDWDIHHLYELEHIWVYLNPQGHVVRVEASWHGDFKDHPVTLEEQHPVLLSEPGKHAFASNVEAFRKRSAERRRSETCQVSAQAHVLINDMFDTQIRRKAFDDTLVRSHLANQAFEPAWNFSKIFRFTADQLVPWPDLRAWIPLRVNAWLERLETSLAPEAYRALRLLPCSGSPDSLERAVQAGADAVLLPVVRGTGSVPMIGQPGSTQSLQATFDFCRQVPMRAILELHDETMIASLADFLKEKQLFRLVQITAARPAWLARFKALAPQAQIVVQSPAPGQDPLLLAKECQASALLLNWDHVAGAMNRITPGWIEQIHAQGMQLISWPLRSVEDALHLQAMRFDALWLTPEVLQELTP